MPIVAHESHIWGEILGTKCCIMCYVEPWWPLAEKKCDRSGRSDHLHDPTDPAEPQAVKPVAEKKPRKPRNTDIVPPEIILHELRNGKPIARIVRELRVDAGRVKRLAILHNIPIRSQGSRTL